MTPSRFVRLLPRDLRRDFGPVEDLQRDAEGGSGRLRYAMPRAWRPLALLLLAAIGAGLAIAAPLLAIEAPVGATIAIGIGALYAAALRLVLIRRARDRTLGHHGRFLPMLVRIRADLVRRRPDMAALRLRHALAARQGLGDARDLCAAIGLRTALPVAAGLWLGADAALLAAAAILGSAAGALAERSRHRAGFRAEIAKSVFGRHVNRTVAAWPTLRDLGAEAGAAERLRRQVPLAASAREARAELRLSALFRLAVPALAILGLLVAAGLPPVMLLGAAIAIVAAGQAGAALGVQAVRIAVARRRVGAADRLFSPDTTPDATAERIDAIAVEGLAFRHANACAPLFEDVSFTLCAGEVLALSSPSGSGKTTLLRVLTLLAAPSAGRVLVNGRDAQGLGYRHRVAAVFQDEPIGAGTIRAAIAGSAPIGLDEVWAAAARVGADTLIRALPMEMQTLIVEGPFPPSLLQPLLIARALAQQPDLLILDEALGALPFDRAKALLDSLRAEGKLVIFASHDPALVALADQVLALGSD